jgi:DMSO/TMAO reductase YedYZ heme-binding membrane subunit
VPTTVGRSRGRQGVHSGAQGAAGDHMRKIMATMIAATVVIIFVLVATKAGHTIDAATQHFMLYYAGVLALVGLTGSVLMGLVATDRIVMTPGHRVMAQAVHRAFAFGTLAFLIIHIATEILAQRSHVIDAAIPFLSPYRTFYIGLGTIASDLIVLLVVTSILRKRFTGHGRAWQWRAIHYSSYVAFVFGVLHGLLGGRAAKPYVDWSYGFAIAATALGLAVRFLAISLRPKETLGSAPTVDRARPSASSPLHAAAMNMAQAQLGGTVQVLPAGMGARGGPSTGTWTATALPAPGWSPTSGPLPALDPAPAYAASAYAASSPSSDGYRDPGFTPLGAPPYGDDVPNGMRGRPYLGDQGRSALAGPAPAGPARQPLYEPGYDGPPRFAGAPRGHGDVPQDELSSYPYGPRGGPAQSAAPYPSDYADRAGSDGRTGPRPGWPESGRPRAALPAPSRQEDRSSGPMPTFGTGAMPQPGTGPMPQPGTGPMPQPGTGPMARPDGVAMPRPDTGPIPRVGNGQPPRNGTGSMPRNGTGPMPRAGTGPMPRADSGPMPRLGTGPMPRPDTGQLPRSDTGSMSRPGTGPMPQPGTGPMPRAGGGPAARPGSGALPQAGPDQASHSETSPLPRPGTGPMARPDTGPRPRPGSGPMPRPGQPAPPADPRTGPLPSAARRPSRRAKPHDPRYRDIPGPTGGDEWE